LVSLYRCFSQTFLFLDIIKKAARFALLLRHCVPTKSNHTLSFYSVSNRRAITIRGVPL
jgi:hypothetical protein